MKWLPQWLTGAGLGLLLPAAAVSVFGGIQTSIGSLRISATSASSLVFEAAMLMLLGECLRGTGRPARLFTVLALFLMAAASDADTRRVGDGSAPVPVATAGCEKALIVGTVADVLWPAACQPRAAPAECAAARALCYANGASVVRAPRQPGFSWPATDAGTP